ncbi:MAG: HAMP domain-containing histidine kinase [Candidatus Obscuribacterales bacterium]|nr:HAMP domain-containing histidine kinase [Candidatus Obscuribacterales bacterium]
MQLRQQIMLLLGIPLICQSASIAILIFSSAKVDSLANSELRAKRAIALSLQIRSLLEQSVLIIAGSSLTGLQIRSTENQEDLIKQHFADLESLSKNSPREQNSIHELKKDAFSFLDTWKSLTLSHQPSQLDRVFFGDLSSSSSKTLPLLHGFKKINDGTEEILRVYTPIAEEFHPKAVQARERLRLAALLAIVFNILLLIPFALLLNKSTLLRLQLLINNMKTFADGGKVFASVGGKDELQALDHSFREMFKQLEKLEELKKAMRAMVSHDLRSPLTSMSLRIELMLDSEEPLGAETEKDLKQLNSESQRLRRLANTLLDIEKMEDGSMTLDLRPARCKDLVEIAVESVLAQCKRKSISVIREIDESMQFLCDKDRAIQVLVNLLSNAVKYSPKNSEIIVRVLESGKNWRCEVLDQGPGVPAEQEKLLFSKFTQLEQAVDTKKQGSGLGLYICKMLIGVQKGKIGFESKESGGSCFWFELEKALEQGESNA